MFNSRLFKRSTSKLVKIKMAPSKCGLPECGRNVAKNSKCIKCFGNCQSWFHIICAGLSNDEFNYFKELGAKAFFKCDICRQLSAIESPLPTTLGKTDIKNDDESVYESSIKEVVKSLSDQVTKLKTQQNNVNEQITFLFEENGMLRDALKYQEEVIGDIVLKKTDNESYASKLKYNSGSVISSDNQNKLACFTNQRTINSIDKSKVNPSSLNLTTVETVNNPEPAWSSKSDSGGHGVKKCTSPSLLRMSEPRMSSAKSMKNEGNGIEVIKEMAADVVNGLKSPVEDSETFKLAISKREKQRLHRLEIRDGRGSDVRQKHKHKFVMGSLSSDDNLKTVEKRSCLFVSRLTPETKCEDLESYLSTKISNVTFKVERLQAKYPDVYSSFKITLPSEVESSVFRHDFWPKGVFVNKFIFKNRKSLNSVDNQSQVAT